MAIHAGGNPLFIIEITGMLVRDERTVPPAGPAPTDRLLPATVQAVIAARIDQLSRPRANWSGARRSSPEGGSTPTNCR